MQPGDSPAGIASRDTMAGCPKCAIDLVRANPHKPAVAFPNGYATFKSLVPGEKINLPDKWFDGSLDSRPHAYFAALPYADGVTPSMLGAAAAGVLADYAALDTASAKVSALAAMGDQPFHDAVEDTASAVDASVQDISGTGSPAIYAAPYAQDVKKATARARASNVDLAAAIAANNDSSFNIRNDILHDFSSAMSSARLALQAFYGDTPPATTVSTSDGFPTNIVTAAHAAADAIAADPNYCASVAQPGSAVNAAVHAFKTAWNSSQSTSVPIGTSSYEQQTADALAKVIGAAPTACAPHVVSSTHPPAPAPVTITKPQELSTGAVVSIGLLGAGVVGGAVYLSTRKPKRRRRR